MPSPATGHAESEAHVVLTVVLVLGVVSVLGVLAYPQVVQARPLPPAQQLQLLLSANVFLLNRDDFRQLASSKPGADVKQILASWWGVSAPQDLRDALDRVRAQLARPPAEQAEALAASAQGRTLPTRSGQALRQTIEWLQARQPPLLPPGGIGAVHLNAAAWNIERQACLVRWGFSVDHLRTEEAWALLADLLAQARRHYPRFEDYSLSYLLVRGMWSAPGEDDAGGADETGDWPELADAHRKLLNDAASPLVTAEKW